MIRVLHIVGGMGQGGTENFLMNVYRNIDRNNIQFDFLVNRKGVFDDEIKQLGGKIYQIPALQKIGQIRYVKKLDNFLKEHKEYKIVHSHINRVSGLILERANKAGISIRIAHSHSSRFSGGCLAKLYKWYLGNKIKDNANYRFACSDKAGKYLFGENAQFDIINDSIDIEKFRYSQEIRKKVRSTLNIEKDCFVIGNVGRFHPSKNHMFLLEIFKEFLKLNEKSKLILIGKGKLKNKIIKYIKKNNLKDKIIMLEDRKDVNELMQAMDFFVFPSKAEGLGMVLIESQAAGLKCIASKDAIPQETKITNLLTFYPLNTNPKKWAEIIYKNRNYERRDTFQEIIDNKYNVNETSKELEKIYINLIDKI